MSDLNKFEMQQSIKTRLASAQAARVQAEAELQRHLRIARLAMKGAETAEDKQFVSERLERLEAKEETYKAMGDLLDMMKEETSNEKK